VINTVPDLLFFILATLTTHFIADFVCQTRKMGEKKSSSVKWLTIHCVVYSFFFLWVGWKYAIINGMLHWIVDFITSRIAKDFYEKGNLGGFWAVVGFDQYIHQLCLIFTLFWIGI
jgi:hypothetical protein